MLRIVSSEQAALAGISACETLEGIPRPGTVRWMDAPFAHPDGTRWAYILSDLSPAEPGDVPNLPADWYPPPE